MTDSQITAGLRALELEFGKEIVKRAVAAVQKFRVEVPGWVFGRFGGGRFGDYTPPGAARTIYEKLDDAAFIHRLTGATETVAMHILWDFSKDGVAGDLKIAEEVARAAEERGVRMGSVSPTYFLKGSHRGSLSSDDPAVRERYIEQTILGGQIAKDLGTRLLTLWFPDGSLYPGQIQLRRAFANLEESLQKAHRRIDPDVTVLIEYKLFEPGTYSTTVSDWGSAYVLASRLGENAGVLVDLGHHPHGKNIEQIVAYLIHSGIKGGFHFNTRYAADDDQAVEPNPEMARIFYELVQGEVILNDTPSKNWAYMIDQCSGRENRMHAVLHSVDSLQLSLAKALLVNGARLRDYQQKDEIILANRMFNAALLNADVRPIVAAARLDRNLPADPLDAYMKSGYREKIETERK